jgi:hypothetical protein
MTDSNNNANNNDGGNNNGATRDKRERYARKVRPAKDSVASLNDCFVLFAHVVEHDAFHVVRAVNALTGVIYHRFDAADPDLFAKCERFRRSMRERSERGRPHYQTASNVAHGECVTLAHVNAVCAAIGVSC